MLRGQSIIHVGDVLGLVSFHPRQSRVKPYDERKSSWQRPRVPSRTPWRAPNPAKRSSRNLEEHRRQRCRQQTGGSFLASKPGSILASAEAQAEFSSGTRDNWRKHHRKIDVGLIDDYYAYRLYAICGDFDKAEQGADEFDQQDPELIAVKSFIEGMRELALPKVTRDAAMRFQEAYEHYPDPLYDYYRGQAFLKLGDTAEAKQALRRFLDHRGEFQQNSIGLALLIPRAEKDLAETKE